MISKTCMITGVRKISKEEVAIIKEEIRCKILSAINDGYTHFMTSLDGHTDYIFAEIIVNLKEKYPITLEAALPYRERIYEKSKRFQKLFLLCNIVGIHSEEYSLNCRKICNRFMIKNSNRVIVVSDGNVKGTIANTLYYALALSKDVQIIP